MTYLFVGAGQAGSAIVDAVFEYTSDSTLGLFGGNDITALAEPMVFNSTIRDLQNLSNVAESDQFGIAEQHGIVDGTTAGFEERVTGGFGRDPKEADEVMSEHADEVVDLLRRRFGSRDGLATDGGGPGWDEADRTDDYDDGWAEEPADTRGDGWEEEPADSRDDGWGDEPADEWAEDTGGGWEDGEVDREVENIEAEMSGEPRDATESEEIQFAFVCLGLGGGTGCGIAPHIVDAIDEYTDGRASIVALAILPNTMGPMTSGGDDEDGGAGRQAWNARYGLDRLEDKVDGIVLVDNQRISYQAAAESQFAEYNEYIAAGIYDLVAGPVLSGIDPSDYADIDTPDIDVQDIVTSLSFGVGGSDSKAGYAALGRAATMTRSLSGYLVPFLGKKAIDSAALVRLATSKQSVSDLDTADAQKAIGLVRAPSGYLAGGSNRIETSTIREYLQAQCALQEVNLGVALNDRNLATVTTLLTYEREDISRIAEIEEKAAEYEERTEAMVQ
ncbi:cell division protein FtsZ [Haloarchaeobius iranensis]|uniref:Tubulin/FtsZ family, GTPase domain n=1 Tax=Haloarchaeobius iranensis TaxID=996166 RepID=A0A1G9UAT9_9EURY|nr:cell division protein FtsZ [Haloarchaeobius iranensis]SDM56953.1 Tubulin/FtsZ family, GTPase domain [Haloarchaeobius iranensis]